MPMPSKSGIYSIIKTFIYFQMALGVFCQLPSISQYHILPIDPILPEAIVGVPYQKTFTVNPSSLNLSQVIFLNASALPQGLQLQNSTLIGTPLLAGNYSIHIQAQIHSIMIQIDANFTLNIQAALILNSSLPTVKLGQPFTLNFAARGGIAPLTWSFQSLPSWASSNGSTLSGQPNTFGNFPFNLTIKDSRNNTLTQNYTLIVQNQGTELLKITPQQIIVTSNVSYSVLLTPSGGNPPYIIQYPNKPSWLSINKNVVQIYVSEMGQFTFPVLIIDSRGSFQTVNIKVKSVNQQAGLIDYINKATTNIVDPRTGIKMTIFNSNWMNNGTPESTIGSASLRSQSSNVLKPVQNNVSIDILQKSSYIKNRTTSNNQGPPCPSSQNTTSSIGIIKSVKYVESQIILANDDVLQFQNCTKQTFRNTSNEFKISDSVTFAGNKKNQSFWYVYSISDLS